MKKSVSHILNWPKSIFDYTKFKNHFYSRPTGQQIFYWMHKGDSRNVDISRASGNKTIEAIPVRQEDYDWAVDLFDELDSYLEPEFVLVQDINDADIRLWGASGYNMMSEDYTLFGFATPLTFFKNGYIDVVINIDGGKSQDDTEDFDPQNTYTALHEIGHALGLSHTGTPGTHLPEWNLYDSEDTVMSYNKPNNSNHHGQEYSYMDYSGLAEIWGFEGQFSDTSKPNIDVVDQYLWARPGKGKIRASSNPDIIMFDHYEEYVGQNAELIKKFSSDDLICFTTASVPILEQIDEVTFAKSSSRNELNRLKRSDSTFVYFEPKGKLYLNGNGDASGWGSSSDGGLLAIFKKGIDLTTSNISILEY